MLQYKQAFKKAFPYTIPVLTGYLFIGIAFGVMYAEKGYSFLWLALLYCVGAYIKEYKPFNNTSATRCFLVFIASSLATIITRISIGVLLVTIMPSATDVNMFVSYTSPLIVIGSVFIFMAFMKAKIGNTLSKITVFLAPMSFGVYAIHCHPLIFTKMANIFVWIIEFNVILGVLLVIACALAIFVTCLFFDWLRQLLFKLCRVTTISNNIETAIKKLKG